METTDAGVRAALRATPRPVVFLLVGVLVNQMGAFVQTFLVLYLTVKGFSLGEAGAALTAYSLGAVVGTLVGGELTHRLGPRGTISAAMAVSAVVLAVVPLALGAYPLVLVAVVAGGVATQAYRPAAAVLVADLVPEEHRVMGFALMRIALNAGAALSPLLAAGLVLVDWDLLFWVDAVTAAGYAVLALRLPRTEAPADEAKVPFRYATMLRDLPFMLFLGSALLAAIVYVQYTVALPLKLTADEQPTWVYSLVLTTSSVVLIACELKVTAHVKNWVPWVAGTVGTALIGLAMAGYGIAAGVPSLLAVTVVFVAGVMISGPTMFAHPATYPAAVRGRYIAAHQATFGLGLAIGPTVGVAAWAAFGDGVWALGGAVGLVAAALAYAGLRAR